MMREITIRTSGLDDVFIPANEIRHLICQLRRKLADLDDRDMEFEMLVSKSAEITVKPYRVDEISRVADEINRLVQQLRMKLGELSVQTAVFEKMINRPTETPSTDHNETKL